MRTRNEKGQLQWGSEEERFWANVHPEPNSGCWIWLGALVGRDEFQYGMFRTAHGEKKTVHVWAYERYVGDIPEGKELHHGCETTCCANPSHLEPLTRKEHLARSFYNRRTHAHTYLADSWQQKRNQQVCFRGHSDWTILPKGRRCRICHNVKTAESKRRRRS